MSEIEIDQLRDKLAAEIDAGRVVFSGDPAHEIDQLRHELAAARNALKAYLTLLEDLRSDVGALDSEGTREAILRVVRERDSLAAIAAVLGEEVARQRK